MKDIFSSLYTATHLNITLGDSKKTVKGHLHHNSYGLSHRCRRHYHASKPSIPRRLSFPLPDIPCRRAAPGTSTPQPSTDSQHCRQTSIFLNAIEYEGFRGSISYLDDAGVLKHLRRDLMFSHNQTFPGLHQHAVLEPLHRWLWLGLAPDLQGGNNVTTQQGETCIRSACS